MNLKFWKKEATREVQPSRFSKRNYKAAENNRLLDGWTNSPVPINAVIRRNLTSLRARSRDQARNNDYVRQYIRVLQNNVIGAVGVMIQSQVVRSDNRNVLDDPANKAIESEYKEAGRSVDITGRITRHDNLRLLLSSMVSDGEYLAVKHKGAGFGKYSYQLELIDPELLDVDKNHKAINGNDIRMGIEYDRLNRPVNYYFKEIVQESYSGGAHRIIPAERVIHVFYPEFVGQERGIPWLSTTLFSLKSMDAYDEAAIVAARIGASAMGFFSSDGSGDYQGEELQDDGSTITSFEPGTFENIGSKTFQQFDPNYPHQQYPHFKKAMLRKMASGLGAQYETLANDRENVNYTSIRHGALEDRENWKAIQEFVISAFVRPDREEWLEMALLSGAIKIGRQPLSRPFNEYLPAIYQPRRWDWVDPSKDMTAFQKEHDLCAISISEIIRKRGRDPDEVFAEIARDNEKMKSMGISAADIMPGGGQVSMLDTNDDYSKATRSGRVTPQIEDEEQARADMGLPPMSEAAKNLWRKQKFVRQPITLKQASDAVEEADDEEIDDEAEE